MAHGLRYDLMSNGDIGHKYTNSREEDSYSYEFLKLDHEPTSQDPDPSAPPVIFTIGTASTCPRTGVEYECDGRSYMFTNNEN